MKGQTTPPALRLRAALAGSVIAITVLASAAVGVSSSGASSRHLSASSSAFCNALVSFEKNPPKPPTSINTTSYHTWAKEYLPLYEKLAASAPNSATKKLLNEVVTILTYEAGASSLPKLEKYVLSNEKQYVNGTKALVAALVSCAGSFG